MKYKFSLYGFLKNQKFFEPFFLLFMINQGFSFFEIGFLLAYREVLINLFEVPSGAIADLFGRRKAMMFSFLNYIVSFVIFYFSRTYFNFYIALLFFAAGEAFRTGTHKAIIADYL
ncbi:MFS transporter, partial [bacterium]|nr:MFS transporter [bacterium]